MCSFEVCLHYKYSQHTLKFWRKRHACNKHCYNSVVFPIGKVLHWKSRDVIDKMMCRKQFDYILPKWKYVLWQCMSYLKDIIPDCELNTISISPWINFHLYLLFSNYSIRKLLIEGRLTCNICEIRFTDGEIQRRKMIQKEFVNNIFMYNLHLSVLDKHIYHIHYVHISSKYICGSLQRDTCY